MFKNKPWAAGLRKCYRDVQTPSWPGSWDFGPELRSWVAWTRGDAEGQGAEWDAVSGISVTPVWCPCAASSARTRRRPGAHGGSTFIVSRGRGGPEEGLNQKSIGKDLCPELGRGTEEGMTHSLNG